MDLPSIADLNEFNRVLLATVRLSDQEAGCRVRRVVALCSSFTLGGHAVDHHWTLKLCNYAKLLTITKGTIQITELGKKFLDTNPNNYYEITDQQKKLVAEQLILHGPWQSNARDLFLSFNPDYDKLTYELSLYESQLPIRYNSIVHLLRALGVLLKTDSVLMVESRYVPLVRSLRATNSGISAQELDQALQTNMKLANQAEEAVLEYERERLRSINRHAEASLVRRISQLDVKAGYDIESFDGDKPLFDYDRFIEVKSSYSPELRFFWSENERRSAEEKGDKYWIYFVGGLSSQKARQIMPILIQNPVTRLVQMSEISIKVATYLIEQSDEIQLKRFRQGKTKGFLL
jgi:hypothetical protein